MPEKSLEKKLLHVHLHVLKLPWDMTTLIIELFVSNLYVERVFKHPLIMCGCFLWPEENKATQVIKP